MSRGYNQTSASQPARIVLVDDHPLVRERLAEVLNREPDLQVCGEAEDCQQALAVIAATQPDLAIIDLTLKNSHGLELIKDVQAQWPDLIMLVLSMHEESLHAERVIRAGARGYITKQEATRKILLAVRRVLSGEVYLSQPMAAEIAFKAASEGSAGQSTPDQDSTRSPVAHLADRELEVFDLIGRGFSTQQIARTLNVH